LSKAIVLMHSYPGNGWVDMGFISLFDVPIDT
jgi:hypothetical protein